MDDGFLSWRNIFLGFIITVILIATAFFILCNKVFFVNQQTGTVSDITPDAVSDSRNNAITSTAEDTPPLSAMPPEPAILPPPVQPAPEPPMPSVSPAEKLKNPPEIIKAVYVTGWSAGSKSYLNYLGNLFKETEINAVVIDIKDYSGTISYNSGAPEARKYNLYNYAILDIDSLVRFFHAQNIYVIGRISVFEDPAYAKARPDLAVYDEKKTSELLKVLWQDNKGLFWLDPASKEVWDYNVSLAKDAFWHGFDEINFDYIRFPSDGKTENMGFPVWDEKTEMAEVIKEFFQYLRNNLIEEKISVDLFGQTTTSAGDMGVGQILEDAFENFDYISPMVYPSHYVNGFAGFQNPAEHPYEVVKYSLDSAVLRKNEFFGLNSVTESDQKIFKFRPWLQDFNMGADYTAEMVKQEIKAVQDSLGQLGQNFNGFMLWNPSNIYTQQAVLKPKE